MHCSIMHCSMNREHLRPEGGGGGGGGGVKVDFPVFTYLIRAAGDEQEEKKPDQNLTLRF